MRWAASRWECRSIAGCSTLGGGATLGGVSVGGIIGVGGSWGVSMRPGSGNTDPTCCGSATCTLMVCFGGSIGEVRG